MAIIIIITDRYKRRRAVAGHYITINIIIIGIECADRIGNTLARGMDYVPAQHRYTVHTYWL